jgi:exodeoxyribonuclease-3
MKITTWNINSVRLRMPLVAHFLKTHAPDVILLQETKCRDAEFPSSDFRALGYGHLAINGQKGYHGVAIASKHPIRQIDARDFCNAGHARHLAVEMDVGGVQAQSRRQQPCRPPDSHCSGFPAHHATRC